MTASASPPAGSIAPPVLLEPVPAGIDAPAAQAPPSGTTDTPGASEASSAAGAEVLAKGKKSAKHSSAESKNKDGTAVASNAPMQGPFAGLQLQNSKSPIDIKSESMSLDYENHSILWTGHVRVNQSDGQVTSDKLRVNYLDKEFKNMKDMVADGNVRISQGTRWATGNHAVMDQIKHTVVLTGSPVVHDGTDQITGNRITVYLDTGRSVVEGAHAVIFPHQDADTASTGAHAGQ